MCQFIKLEVILVSGLHCNQRLLSEFIRYWASTFKSYDSFSSTDNYTTNKQTPFIFVNNNIINNVWSSTTTSFSPVFFACVNRMEVFLLFRTAPLRIVRKPSGPTSSRGGGQRVARWTCLGVNGLKGVFTSKVGLRGVGGEWKPDQLYEDFDFTQH